ncbi:HAD-IB family hydrolase [Variovorax sp. YR752]|uniref:HAD family hydrolase n=1 Tax=Variovorax sp. YR752 TaxID=1884383 RepID=UPI003137782D
MNLALFDLDHTLIGFDSGMAWTQHLVGVGALDAAAEQRYLDFCHQYVAGTLDIHAMHRAVMTPLAALEPAQLTQWRDEFAQAMAQRLSPAARELVARHRDAGDLCAIVTATSRWVAEPFAQAFGIAHLVATEPVMIDGRPAGDIDGLPCYREHKPTRVEAWLAAAGLPALAAFDASWFYSDSASDLPLLQCVTNPVAVRPDPRLRERCLEQGWPVIDLL